MKDKVVVNTGCSLVGVISNSGYLLCLEGVAL